MTAETSNARGETYTFDMIEDAWGDVVPLTKPYFNRFRARLETLRQSAAPPPSAAQQEDGGRCSHEAWEENGGWCECVDCGHGWSARTAPPSAPKAQPLPNGVIQRHVVTKFSDGSTRVEDVLTTPSAPVGVDFAAVASILRRAMRDGVHYGYRRDFILQQALALEALSQQPAAVDAALAQRIQALVGGVEVDLEAPLSAGANATTQTHGAMLRQLEPQLQEQLAESEHAAAAQAAEIEALRAEVERANSWNERVSVCRDHVADIVDGPCVICALDAAEARADKLAEALRGWWKAHRPVGWTEDQHRSCPHVNLATDAEKALATALLRDQEEGK